MPRFHWFFNPLREAEGVAGGGEPPAPSQGVATAEPASAPAEGEASPQGNGSLIPGTEGEAAAEPAKPEAPAPLTVEGLALPEGMKADDPALAKFIENFNKTDGTPAERAQALLNTYKEQATSIATQAAEATHTKLAGDYKAINDGWIAEVKADPILSKPENMGVVAKALDSFGNGPELRKAFALTGAGNNPHVLRLIHTMASQLTEGRPAQGGAPSGTKSAADVFYPSAPST